MYVTDDIPVNINVDSSRFFDQFRAFLRLNGYSYPTEKTYMHWCLRYVRFHNKKHPKSMHNKEVSEFLNHLAIDLCCAAGTQRIALNALVCLYTKFLKRDLGNLDFNYASVPKRSPIVLTHAEALKVIDLTSGDYQLILRLLYGTGLRRAECLSLRIKDIDFARGRIMVHQGKGNKDRSTLLPDQLIDFLHEKIGRVKKLHQYDLENGFGLVPLPKPLSKHLNRRNQWRRINAQPHNNHR